MRIALISQPRDFIVAGGTQRGSVAIVTYELARRLADRHDVTLYAPLGPGQPATERCQETLLIRRISRARRRLHRAIELGAGLVEWGGAEQLPGCGAVATCARGACPPRVFGGVGQERLPELYRRAASMRLAARATARERFGSPMRPVPRLPRSARRAS